MFVCTNQLIEQIFGTSIECIKVLKGVNEYCLTKSDRLRLHAGTVWRATETERIDQNAILELCRLSADDVGFFFALFKLDLQLSFCISSC